MRFFPRHTVLAKFSTDIDPIAFILKSFWAIPQKANLFNGTPYLLHEKSAFISPVALIGIVVFIISLIITNKRIPSRKILFIVIYLLLFFVFMIQLMQGHGVFADKLHLLPAFSSQHVATRYIYIFALFVSGGGVYCFYLVSKTHWPHLLNLTAIICGYITLLTFFLAYSPILDNFPININIESHFKHYVIFNESMDQPVTKIVGDAGWLMGDSGLNCYEPLINNGGNPQKTVLHVGSVADISNGYFNIMNPACYQYPSENDCTPGDRIAVSDSDNFRSFIKGNTVKWRFSTAQKTADIVSLCALCVFTLCLVLQMYRHSKSYARSCQ